VCRKMILWNALSHSEHRREAGCGVTHPPLPGLLEVSLGDGRIEQIGNSLHEKCKDEASSFYRRFPQDAQLTASEKERHVCVMPNIT
jgi:hypothetical protein